MHQSRQSWPHFVNDGNKHGSHSKEVSPEHPAYFRLRDDNPLVEKKRVLHADKLQNFSRVAPVLTLTVQSSTGSDSTIDSESEPVSASPALQENPFKTAFATPQSSVVNVVLRRAALQARATKFVECDCVNGGLCVDAAAQEMERHATMMWFLLRSQTQTNP